MNPENRSGILAAGNFITDRIREIDAFPEQDMLANIVGESRSNGGGPYNILKDLAAMGVPYPLAAAGQTGSDEGGRWIREDCHAHGIDTTFLTETPDLPTSYTEVMSVRDTGRRTFFHRRGANATFDGSGIDFATSPARIFHLAYLMLLDTLDSFAPDGRTRASHLLEQASAAGLTTSIDIVSTENPRFRETVLSALPHTDHLLINEAEAGRVLGRALDPADSPTLAGAAQELLGSGVRQSVVLHTRHGAACARHDGTTWQMALDLPSDQIRGSNGAGDAFAAGYLHGTHEHLPVQDTLKLAVCTAAACLTDPTPSAGLRPLPECIALGTHDAKQ